MVYPRTCLTIHSIEKPYKILALCSRRGLTSGASKNNLNLTVITAN